MGNLLKEVLKSLCGSSQWSYAVFWKIGFQNPKLLIWEECHYEPSKPPPPSAGSAEIPFGEWEKILMSSETCASQLGSQAGDRVSALVSKMMISNQVNILGEGIVGRAAFTGNHQWILLNTYSSFAHPPEVLNEMHHQFSGGMQTVAVIPVFPHGVVQLGSSLDILENIGFINDVRRMILQLGCIPGALLSDNYPIEDSIETIGIPVSAGHLAPIDPSGMLKRENSPYMADNYNRRSNLSQASNLSHSYGMNFGAKSHSSHCQSKDVAVGAELIPPNASAWSGLDNNASRFSQSHSAQSSQLLAEPRILSGSRIYNQLDKYQSVSSISHDHNVSSLSFQSHEGRQTNGGMKSYSFSNTHEAPESYLSASAPSLAGKELQKSESDKAEAVSSRVLDQQYFANLQCSKEVKPRNGFAQSEQTMDSKLFQTLNIPMFDANEHIPSDLGSQCAQPSSGDDLFDIFGKELKNKLLSSNRQDENSLLMHENTSRFPGMKVLYSNFYTEKATLDDSVFSGTGTDHLLDAVVSKAQFTPKQSSDDNVSCGTTLTKISNSSVLSSSPAFARVTLPDHIRGEKLQLPDPPNKVVLGKSSSFKSSGDPGNCSQTTSAFGSHVSSWVEQGNSGKHDHNSISTGYSKRPDETGKSNRKRLKPGENPRPRPKDRQMIQDRVKELRELVPHGGKCSIDALLERTIKHMLFLQSVMKHSDKLKQTGESKIVNKEGGLVLKDNFEGGAIWALEVGSQSMVCPIIVEDLNAPRQMLVEMLCEERGFFLEIADLIRGLGLTILKGVMEARKDKIWARFAIEANRDVTRMEIFMSLVHLLEQTAKNGDGSTAANAVETGGSFPIATAASLQ